MSSGRIALMAALALAPVFSQIPTGRVHDHNLHAWFVYAGDHALAGRWGVHLEGQWRRHDAGLRPQQLLLRPAVNYQLNPSVAFSTGYAYVTTHRYGEYPVLAPFPEHRIYQQATVQHKAKRLDLLHRFRLEQRWIGQRFPEGVSPPEIQPWRYQNRFRYMLRAVIPLGRKDWYFASQNEIFLNYAPTHGARVFDQNRAYAAVGRPLGRDTRIEVGYLLQTLLQRNARVLEQNHTIHVAVFSRLPFGRGSR